MPSQTSDLQRTLPPNEFYNELFGLRQSYHLEHNFQVMMNAGKLSHEQMQGWVLNRYYYQRAIPLKDAAILSNCEDREVRRLWIARISDQDGTQGGEGGLEAWIALGMACGLSRDDVTSLKHVLPTVRFAVDAYVNFAKTSPWQEAVCASLTELFAGEAHRRRLEAFPIYYPWIREEGLAYFRNRLGQAKRDVDHGLQITLSHFNTRALQLRAVEILKFKMDILWTMLDAMELAYVTQAAKKEHLTWIKH